MINDGDGPKLETLLEKRKEDFKLISCLPDDYDASAEKWRMTFAERLKNARETAIKRRWQRNQDGHNKPQSEQAALPSRIMRQEEVGAYIRVSTTMIHKYESGKIKKVPLNRLQPLCDILEVTPHYLLGLVDDYQGVLDIREGKRVKDGNNKDRVLQVGIVSEPTLVTLACETYNRLYVQDSELFWLIDWLVNTLPQSRNYYKGILRALLDHDRFSLK